MNNNEIILSLHTQIERYFINDLYIGGINKYNIIKQESILFMKYPDFNINKEFILGYHTMSFDKIENKLYLLDGNGSFLIINMNTKKY